MITLNKALSYGKIYINPDEIQAVFKSSYSSGGRYPTKIALRGRSAGFWDDGCATVRETPDEVMAMIEEAKK